MFLRPSGTWKSICMFYPRENAISPRSDYKTALTGHSPHRPKSRRDARIQPGVFNPGYDIPPRKKSRRDARTQPGVLTQGMISPHEKSPARDAGKYLSGTDENV